MEKGPDPNEDIFNHPDIVVFDAEADMNLGPEFELTDEMIQRTLNRRTDDPMHNRDILRKALVDREKREFLAEAISYVSQQALSELAEADIHELGTPVFQEYDPEIGQFASFIGGNTTNAINGVLALDMDDELNHFEFYRRVEEVTETKNHTDPERMERMSKGEISVFASPRGTHHEIDPDIAESFGYGDRDMLRIHKLSPDKKTKTIYSFAVFNIPIEAWAGFYSQRLGRPVEASSLAVMKAANEDDLFDGSGDVPGVLREIRAGLEPFLDGHESISATSQFYSFITKQEELLQKAEMYVQERVEFEKDLALSEDFAVGAVKRAINILYDTASEERKQIIEDSERPGGEFAMSERLARAIWELKVVTNFNRAGVAVENERTVNRLRFTEGADFVHKIQQMEQDLYFAYQNQLDGLIQKTLDRAEAEIAKAKSLSCSGGCAAEIGNESFDPSDLLDGNAARKAGLKGRRLYKDKKGSKQKSSCKCIIPNLVYDGEVGVCVNKDCGVKSDSSHKEAKEAEPTWLERQIGVKSEDDQEDIDAQFEQMTSSPEMQEVANAAVSAATTDEPVMADVK